MTPLPAANPAPANAPVMAARGTMPARQGQTTAQPSFESVRQEVAATIAPPSVEPADTKEVSVDLALELPSPVAPQPVPTIIPAVLTLPQLPVVSAEAFSPTLAAKPAGIAALSTTAPAPAFFDDTDSVPTDAADFAADLLAAMGSSNTTTPVTDLTASAKIDAPMTTDVAPELDMTSDAWLDQLARDITATASTDGKLSFRIVPPQLGRLDINIETRDAGVAVHMKAETREAQSILVAAQPRLESAMGQNGIRVAETSVTQNGQENLPKPHFIPQKALIEAVNDIEPEADTPTLGRAAGRFA